MATKTLGTAGTTTLLAVGPYTGPAQSMADVAALALSIKDDQNVTHPVIPGSFVIQGLLYVPNRGVLRLLPNDWVATDPATGFPILISSRAAAGASWVHN